MCTRVRKIQRSSSMLRTLLHTPSLCYLYGSSPSKSNSSNLSRPSMATFARIVVVKDIMSSLSIICFYMNLETLALCEMTIFCFFFFFFFLNEIWGFWSIMIESARRYKDTSIPASISLSLFLLWKIYLFLSVICFIYIYNISYFLN